MCSGAVQRASGNEEWITSAKNYLPTLSPTIYLSDLRMIIKPPQRLKIRELVYFKGSFHNLVKGKTERSVRVALGYLLVLLFQFSGA